MSMIFEFRMLSDENDAFVRDYRILYNATLLDFHNHICADLCFDPGAMASFFESDRQWNKLSEYTLIDMGEEEGAIQTMSDIALNYLISDNGDRMIYMFDAFGDRSFYLEMIGAKKSDDGVQYPCTTRSDGNPPEQFVIDEFDSDLSIFDDVMEEFADFEGNEVYDDEF